MGLPIPLKDIIDAAPMFTSAGDWALRDSFAPDSGVAAELKAHGVVILGKTGLSEWANSFGSQPSGFSNLTGQVLNANDTVAGPSGSSSGSGAAAAAGEAALTIGTETSGSIISPSTAEEDVGLRPTVGLVPGYGIAPIDVSQDTAGPIVRTVSDAAITLDSIAEVPGSDPTANKEYLDVDGPELSLDNGDVPAPPFSRLPNYLSALTTSSSTASASATTARARYPATGTSHAQAANDRRSRLSPTPARSWFRTRPRPSRPRRPCRVGYEAHATINDYYKGIDPHGAGEPGSGDRSSTTTTRRSHEKYSNSPPAADRADDTTRRASQAAYERALPLSSGCTRRSTRCWTTRVAAAGRSSRSSDRSGGPAAG